MRIVFEGFATVPPPTLCCPFLALFSDWFLQKYPAERIKIRPLVIIY
jgi:hypothetical protein